jgi:hypothetical protein
VHPVGAWPSNPIIFALAGDMPGNGSAEIIAFICFAMVVVVTGGIVRIVESIASSHDNLRWIRYFRLSENIPRPQKRDDLDD